MSEMEKRERLARIRERISAARDERARLRQAASNAREANDPELAATAEGQLQAAEENLQQLRSMENLTLQQLATGTAMRELGSVLRSNFEAHQMLAELAASTAAIRTNVPIGPLMTMEETVGLTGRALHAALDVPDGGGATGFVGPIAPPAPPTSLLDFFGSVPFTTRTADVMRRSGAADAAIQVAGTIKHEASLTYTADSLRALTVASWLKANRQDLDDVEALLADIQQALRYGVLVKVEDLLLNGAPADADGGAVPGLLDAPFTPTVTATTLDGAVGQMKAQLIATGVQPNFAAANAVTIEAEESRVGTDGHPVNAISDDGRIRRLPLVSAEALADGQVLVGDSRVAARLGVRQPISLLIGQEADDMTRNRVTILTEGRWTPLVSVPTAIAHFTLGSDV
jgi:hypothetical protein